MSVILWQKGVTVNPLKALFAAFSQLCFANRVVDTPIKSATFGTAQKRFRSGQLAELYKIL